MKTDKFEVQLRDGKKAIYNRKELDKGLKTQDVIYFNPRRNCTNCGNEFGVLKQFPRGTICEKCGREDLNKETPSDAFPEETSEELGV